MTPIKKTSRKRVVKGWMYIWPDKTRQVVWKRVPEAVKEPLACKEHRIEITYEI